MDSVHKVLKDAELLRREIERARKADWRQAVSSQHTVLATLAGLQVTALTLFSAFSDTGRTCWQKLFFVTSLIAFVVIVFCLTLMAEHERRDAFNSGQVTDKQRNHENTLRRVVNWATISNGVSIALLLTLSYLG